MSVYDGYCATAAGVATTVQSDQVTTATSLEPVTGTAGSSAVPSQTSMGELTARFIRGSIL
jgi:hypothetical protein